MPSRQATQELDDEELLLELPLLRLDTDGATGNDVGGEIVRSAVRAPGMFPEAPHRHPPTVQTQPVKD